MKEGSVEINTVQQPTVFDGLLVISTSGRTQKWGSLSTFLRECQSLAGSNLFPLNKPSQTNGSLLLFQVAI